MPLPKEQLDNLKKQLDKARAKLTEIEDVINDLRSTGINTADYAEKRKLLLDQIKQLEAFYNKQIAKL